MTRPRRSLVSADVTRYYHCITKCVRQAFLLQEGKTDRKKWLIDRLMEIAEIYAVSVCNYGILDNHFHLLLRLDVETANAWTDEEVIRRWASAHPPKKKRKLVEVTDEWIAGEAQDKKKVEKLRSRLCNLGWFMKEVKEPLARLCNREDGRTGTFFEGRFKSIGILDEEALLATACYIDLNPFAAGIAPAPELCVYTSLFERIAHARRKDRLDDLASACLSSILSMNFSAGIEEGLWLAPIQDRRAQGSHREGLFETFTLGKYLLLIDTMARKPRVGKACLPPEAAGIFQRLGLDLSFWTEQYSRDYAAQLVGSFFACSPDKLKDAATSLCLHHCCNLSEKIKSVEQSAINTTPG